MYHDNYEILCHDILYNYITIFMENKNLNLVGLVQKMLPRI